MRQLETEIWHACQREFNNPRMRKKDLLEWSTGPVQAGEGEVAIRIEHLGVNVVVAATMDKRVAG